MRTRYFLFLFLFTHTLFAANLPPGFVETAVATGLDPTGMAQAPDGRIFIIEKYGAVRIVENNVLLPDPFLVLDVDNYNERGLSGIAFDPDFSLNGYVYLYYTVKNAGHNRLSRVQALGNYAVPGSEEVLLELDPMAASVHNAGAMAFGSDGKLYLAVGEGSDGTKSHDPNSLLGKVLRLNPDGTIPDDNPFYQQFSGVYRAVYATGLRNPFSLTIQPGANRILVGDVGSSFFEEINLIEAGMDYGWNLLEGKRSNQNVPANYRDPLYAYAHNIGCAVVGMAFYNPPVSAFPPQYTGRLFFGDYCNKKINMLNPETGQLIGTFASNINRPLAVLTGIDGSLYYISRGGLGGGSELDNTSSGDGILWRVRYVGVGAPVFSVSPANTLVVAGETAVFAVQANGSPTITFQWQRDGEDIPGAIGDTLALPAVSLADSGAVIRCLAKNPYGQVSSQEAVLRVTGNQRPLPVILTPVSNYLYAAGDTIWFSGQATDPETGLLSEDDLSWRLDLHHDQHTHPGLSPLHGVAGGFYVVPRIGETDDNVWLRIYLSAHDPAGLSRTVYLDVFPQKTKLRLESSPPGLPIRVDGKTYTTPFEVNSVKGMLRQVQTQPSFQHNPDTLTVFDQWSDGETNPNRIVYAEDALTTLKAEYRDIILKGYGAYGLYYSMNPDMTFDELIFTRVDTTIDFSWMEFSPDPRLPDDRFGVRWLAYLEPAVSEQYLFHAITDDGFRLKIDGEVVVDQWWTKGPTEVTAAVFLEKGKRYALELEYFEWWGHATAKLLWSSPTTPKDIIPKKRLFPRLPDAPIDSTAHFAISLRPNPVRNLLTLVIDADVQQEFDLRLFDNAGRLVREWRRQRLELVQQEMSWPVSDLQAGVYHLELQRETGERMVKTMVKI